jgi:hypothetical protein
LRDAVSAEAGLILCHHTKKITKKQLIEDPFQALSGAGSLRGFYTAGILMHRPDEDRPERMLQFELRNGPAIEPKVVDKVNGRWIEIDRSGERLIRKSLGEKLDAERIRKRDVILQILFEEARQGRTPAASSRKRSRTRPVSAATPPSANGSRCSPPRATSSSSATTRTMGS